MLVLSSPSGAGKTTTLSRKLLETERAIESVGLGDHAAAAARRDRWTRLSFHRQDAVRCDGANNELLEWAEVFGNCYGTPRAPVEAALAAGRDVVVRHRLAGHAAVARKDARADLVSIFVLPPSIPELERRLRSRAQDQDDVIHRRMAKAADEMSHWAGIRLRRRSIDDLEQAFCRRARNSVRRAAQAPTPDRDFPSYVRGLQAEL